MCEKVIIFLFSAARKVQRALEFYQTVFFVHLAVRLRTLNLFN